MHYLELEFERAVADVLSRDPELAEELRARAERGDLEAGAERLSAGLGSITDDPRELSLRAYEYSVVRPVLNVKRHDLVAVQSDAVSETWTKRVKAVGERLLRAIDATGRIELKGGDTKFSGTGFMIREDVVATNHHVADDFAEVNEDDEIVFILNLGGNPIEASIDFREEIGVVESLEFRVEEVLHMDADSDLAFLRVVPKDARKPLPRPLELSTDEIPPNHLIAAIGYPKQEIRDAETTKIINRTFGNVFDKKRVSPGQVCAVEDGNLVHDCSVLGGNSGSPVISLETGMVIGIHFDGEFLKKRFAIPAAAIDAELEVALERSRTRRLSLDAGRPAAGIGLIAAKPPQPSRHSTRTDGRGLRTGT
jgi:endonuclease G